MAAPVSISASIAPSAPEGAMKSRFSSVFAPMSTFTSAPAPPSIERIGSFGSTSPSTTGWKAIIDSTISPHLAGSGIAWISADMSICASRICSIGAFAIASLVGSTPNRFASSPVISLALSRVTAWWPAPLCMIAPRKRPFAFGLLSRHATLMPPADSPPIVTRDGSPPKPAMLSRTHSQRRDLVAQPEIGHALRQGRGSLRRRGDS